MAYTKKNPSPTNQYVDTTLFQAFDNGIYDAHVLVDASLRIFVPFHFAGVANLSESDSVPVFGTANLARIKVRIREAPTGSPLVVSIRKNGVEVRTVSIPAGSTQASASTPLIGYQEDDAVSVAITQIGSSNPGTGVTCVLELASAPTPATQTSVFTIAAGVDDQRVQRRGATYPPVDTVVERSSTVVVAGPNRSLASGEFNIRNLLLRWNTAALPDSTTIIAASFRAVVSTFTATSRELHGEYYPWTGSSDTDYVADSSSGAFTAPLFRASPIGFAWSIPLSDTSGISKTGVTSMRLHVSGGQPTDQNFISFHAFENIDGFTPMQLIVEHTP